MTIAATRNYLLAIAISPHLLLGAAHTAENRAPSQLDAYNVAWTAPGTSDRDSMPLGNGEVGISLWAEQDGDLQFYIARSDAQTELDRNVKLGKVCVRLSPNPFAQGLPFTQTLVLRDGAALIDAGDVHLRVFVDADHPVIHVVGETRTPMAVTAIFQDWRTDWRGSIGDGPGSPARESADVVHSLDGGILAYHRNGGTCIPYMAELQGLKDQIDVIPDALTNRTFGVWMTMTDAAPSGGDSLATTKPVRSFDLKIATHSQQLPSVEQWIAALRKIDRDAGSGADAAARSARWWNDYWNRSWIFLDGSADAERITQAYTLTKWMFACASRANFPIRFNGSLFNLMPAGDGKVSVMSIAKSFTDAPTTQPSLAVNPDIRPWGHSTLWQNIRLPYASMLARDEPESLRVLFRFYRRFWEMNRARAKIYYGAEGQHNTELTLTFGLQDANVYGVDRKGLAVGYSANRWGGAVDISPGLELLHLMLDDFEYNHDDGFLRDELLPYAHDLFRYIETRFTTRADGKIVLAPLQSVETYHDTTDPITVVAGMHAVLDRLLALPGDRLGKDADFFRHTREITPDLPRETIDGHTLLAPARIYDPKRSNVESPVFYAIFPFRLFGVGKPDLEMAVASYRHACKISDSFHPFEIGWAPDKPSYSGWQQHGMTATLLGLSGDASDVLIHNTQLANHGNRFPAMWGPIYDAVPDCDHGANILSTLQLMLIQTEGKKIFLLPAWTKSWSADFKLYAPGHTIIQASVRDGKVIDLQVTPKQRIQDVIQP